MRMRHTVICGPSSSTNFFHTISQAAIFEKNVIDNKMCHIILSTTLSETFVILRRMAEDVMKVYIDLYGNC
jgi:hypothetical protein